MNTVPEWHLAGDWFDICSCNIPCPCEFAQAPTNNACAGMLAWHVREGHYGDVRLDGLNLLALGAFEGNVWADEGKLRMGLFIDERADERQRQAFQMVFGGQAGGWPAIFAGKIGELRGVEFVPITFEVADDLAFWRAEIPGRVVGRAKTSVRTDNAPWETRPDHQSSRLRGGPGPSRHLGSFGRIADRRIRLRVDRRKLVKQAHPVRLDGTLLTGGRGALSDSSLDNIARFDWLRPRSVLGRAGLSLLVSLAVLTCAAWALTLYRALRMSTPMDGMSDAAMSDMGISGMGMSGMGMSGMSAADWSFASAGVFLAVLTVMMAAMMLPAAAPMIVVFASAQARREPSVVVPTWIFVAGYLLVWVAAGVAVFVLVQIGSEMATLLTATGWSRWAPVILGATLVAAGLYQFTPLKLACLSHCRSPLAFVAQHWREGRLGALRIGLLHGSYCLGCCWALFAVLVAAGVMSPAWMLLLTLIVFVEKVLPKGQRISAAIGVWFVALGLAIAGGNLPPLEGL